MDETVRRSPSLANTAPDAPSPTRPSVPLWARIALLTAGLVVALIVALFLFLAQTNWNWLRAPVARYASAHTGRQVRIDGDLTAHLLSWTPEVDLAGLKVGNPAWAGPGDVADVNELRMRVRFWPLLIGRVELVLVELRAPRLDLVRDINERENWVLGSAPAAKPLQLPPIQRFLVTDGLLHLNDARRRIVFDGTFEASEKPRSSGGRGFALTGLGHLNGEQFAMLATGGPLIEVRRDRPYPFHMDVRSGPTHAVVDGAIRRPFDLGAIDGTVAVDGSDLARLYDLTGVTLPNTPPYRLAAHFERRGSLYNLTDLKGTVGASDLQGQLSLDRPQGRRKLTADLSSRRLVLADLTAVTGGGPKAPVKPAAVVAGSGGGRLLPDAPLLKDRLRAMDADVRYRAESVQAGRWPLTRAALTLKLDNGVLTLDPLALELSQGRLGGKVRIDARDPTVKTDLDLTLANIGLQQLPFMKPSGSQQPAVEGMLQARAQLHGMGNSVHKAAASSSGRVAVVTPHGAMRQAFAELLGINVGRGLFLLLSKSPKQTDIRCAVAEFEVQNGVMYARRMVIDTGVVTTVGSGTVDLGAETLNLKLQGKTKKPELLRVWAPITLKGTLSKPVLGVDAGAVAAQGGLGAAIAAALGPLTVLLPFISPGLAKDADCVSLVADAKTLGVPGKVSATTPNAPPKH